MRAALTAGGAPTALRALAGGVSLLLLPVAFVLRSLTWDALASGSSPKPSDDSEASRPPSARAPVSRRTLATLWLTLLCGSGPGLLCHGHAAAIWHKTANVFVWLTPKYSTATAV